MDRSRIASHSFFAGLPDEELDAVTDAASEQHYAAGEPLMSKGDFGHCMLLIEEGAAEVSVDGTRVRTVGPGDVVGEVAILSSGRRTASVVATAPVRAFSFFKRDVWALERTAPEAARRLRAAIEQHVGSAWARALALRRGSKHAHSSLAKLAFEVLRHLQDSYGALPGRPLVVHCPGDYRASIAASLLRRQGFEHVTVLVGGIAAWEAASPDPEDAVAK